MVEPTRTEDSSTAHAGRREHWRTLVSRTLLVIFCTTLALSLVAVWASKQVTNTDRYVRTVAPLAHDPVIQAALADRVAELLSEHLDAAVTMEFLPGQQDVLAAPLAFAVEQYIHETAERVIASDAFAGLWEQINRSAHPVVSAVLTGQEGETTSLDDGQITIDIEPLLTEVMERLREEGFDIVNRIQLDQLNTSFVVFESSSLARAQEIVGWIERLSVALPLFALGWLVGTITLAGDRRSAVIQVGIGTAISMALLLMLLYAVRWLSINDLPPEASPEAATAFFNTVTRYMRRASLGLLVLGILIATVASLGSMGRRDRPIPEPA